MRSVKATLVLAAFVAFSGAAALAALLGVSSLIGLPMTDFVGPTPTSGTAFDATSRAFTVTANPISTNFGSGAKVVDAPEGVAINVLVQDNAGQTVGSTPGDDFSLSGQIDTNGDNVADYSGVLLTGEVLAMGWSNGASTTDRTDFRFRATGGALLALYSGKDIGVTVTMEASTFAGTFASNFASGAKGIIGPIPCAGTIGDFVWHDADKDGIQDPGEAGLNGVIVTLTGTDNFGNPVSLTTTTGPGPMGQQGYYQLGGLCAGTYALSAATPAGYVATTSLVGGDTGVDSNGSPTTVTLTGLSDQTIDFGFVTECTGKIGDFVWHDLNRNGVQDAGEPGIGNVDVSLLNPADDSVIATTTTDANGYYSFGGLCAGNYKIKVDEADLPPGFVATPPGLGGNPATDSNTNPSIVNLPLDNTQDLTIDFGYQSPCLGTLGDFVWYDKNQNGLQDVGETGIAGVTVRLKDSSGATVLQTTATDANGIYGFGGLCAGSYRVEVDASTVPGGFSPTAVAVGGDQTVDSNPNPFLITLATDVSTDVTIDFGYIAPCAGQIGDFVWKDLDNDGVQDAGEPGIAGVVVNLKDMANTVIQTDTTDANGNYLFIGLCPGQYRVEVVPPAGAIDSPPLQGGPATDSNLNPSTVTVLLDDSIDLTIDFGFYFPPARLGDFVWNDQDQDGQQDVAEPGIVGVPVTLLACDGVTVLATTVTTAGGAYLFSHLDQGCYRVRFDLPAGYVRTLQDVGADASDSDASVVNGVTGPYSLSWGEFNRTVDAGVYLAGPKIDIEKYTNGDDADTPTGPVVAVGSAVTWTYVVTNTGNVPLTNVVVTDDKVGAICTIGPLAVGQSQTCTATGTAQAGQYVNTGTVTGNYNGTPVTDSDPSHYFGAKPELKLVKLTNGTDNNSPTGPPVPVGSTVTWTYRVTNTGNVTLTNIVVRDDNGTPANSADDFTVCTIASLAPGATQTCTASKPAVAGQYKNWGTATTTYNGTPVTSTDPDHYFGAKPAIALVKLTNGTDNNSPTGPEVWVGSTVTWTYRVTNTGTVTLTNVVVRDDNGTAGSPGDDFTVCTIASLAVGVTQTCTKTGIAVLGQYKNTGTATGTYNGSTVTAQDVDHYYGKAVWANETAVGAGILYPHPPENWFTYTPYSTMKVNLIAGQHYDAGDIYMSRTSTHTTIKIVLHAGWRWAPVSQNLKIQPFNNAPAEYVQPGAFDHKFTVSGDTITVTIKGTSAKFYGIHGDVQRNLQ